jgi:TRAP-type C4-dicarboxylate transport system substrate-binding protein
VEGVPRVDVVAESARKAELQTAPTLSRRAFVKRGLLAGLSAGAWLPAARAAGGPVKVRLATLAPKDSSFHQSLKVMAAKWLKAPGGGVELTVYTDGTMGGEADVVRRMRIGQLQAAMLTASGLVEIDPAVAGLEKMPLIYRTLEEVAHVREKLAPRLEQRFAAKGFHLLGWADAGWVRFFTKHPATRPADFKKFKIFTWAGDKDHIELMQSEGYRPVPLEYTDTLTGLQTGLIDAVPTSPYYALAGQFFTAVPHMLGLNWAPLAGGIVVTKKAWDAIPPEAQPVVGQAGLEAARDIQAKSRQEGDEAVAAMVKRGLMVHQLSPEDEAEWRKFGEQLAPKLRGKMVPADIFDEVQRLLKEYRAAKP